MRTVIGSSGTIPALFLLLRESHRATLRAGWSRPLLLVFLCLVITFGLGALLNTHDTPKCDQRQCVAQSAIVRSLERRLEVASSWEVQENS